MHFIESLHFRFATPADIPALVPMINAAFIVESFLDAPRTNSSHLAAQMQKGRILVAQDDAGQIPACIYIESRGNRAYLGMFAVAPGIKAQASAAVSSKLQKTCSAPRAFACSNLPC